MREGYDLSIMLIIVPFFLRDVGVGNLDIFQKTLIYDTN